MKKYGNKIIELVREHKIITSIVVLVFLVIGYSLSSGNGNNSQLYVVKRGEVVQKVIVNGKTVPVNSVSLGLETSGTVSRVFVEVGSKVYAGQILLTLESSSLNAELLRAEANLASENAKLDEMRKGTRPEELAVAQTTLDNAKRTFSDAQVNLRDKVTDIIGNNIDQLFSNPHTNNPQFNLIVSDSQLLQNINFGRTQVEGVLNSWSIETGENNLAIISTFIDNVAKAVNGQTSTPSLSQATIDGYKTALSSAKNTLITYRDALTSAKSALVLAQKNYDLKKSGSTPEAISSQEAKVLQAEADKQSASAKLSKTTLRSPQNGVVTKQDAKVGEVVTSGAKIISIISDNSLEIESNVSEISIGKVSIGNKVEIRFDAFPEKIYMGKVSYIEPAETIIDGVVNYKTTVNFDEYFPEIKSGLTSKLDIITATREDSLIIPQYAITEKSDGQYVSKLNGRNYLDQKVEIGIRGQDGSVEVLSGLNEGDTVLVGNSSI